MQHPRALLASIFGFGGFRPGQEEIVDAVLAGRDTLAIMPTGGGKSLCFQLPALCRGGVTVVISPLIALMRDQVRSLREAGVEA
ncbi:MAG: DEAD/DEAH box helicase, partial [Gemmobacter sp.]